MSVVLANRQVPVLGSFSPYGDCVDPDGFNCFSERDVKYEGTNVEYHLGNFSLGEHILARDNFQFWMFSCPRGWLESCAGAVVDIDRTSFLFSSRDSFL